MSETARAVPTSIRRLEANEDARRLTSMVSAYDELQTVLRCHMAAFAALGGAPRRSFTTG